MQLSSKAIPDGSEIELKYTEQASGGQNIIPDLTWSDAPEGTKSFAITVYDPDAPTGSGWWHWVAANIPSSTTSLAEGEGVPAEAREFDNDYGYLGYGGACPPPGPAHRYVHTVYALDVAQLGLDDDATSAMARMTILGHALDQASFTARFAQPE